MATIYILQKFLSILLLFRLKFLYGIISIFLSFIIFFYKEARVDIIGYIKLVNSEVQYELIYSAIIDLIYFFINDSTLTITIYQLFLLSIASSIIFFFKENKILILSIIISSVAIMLAVYNNLRQGTSSIFILLGIILYIKNYKKLGSISMITSLGFHHSSIYFISLFCLSGIVYKYLIPKDFLKKNIRIYCISLVGFFLALFISILIINFIDLSKFKLYLDMDIALDNPDRVPHPIKITILIFFWLCSEAFIKFSSIDSQIDFFRYLRQFIIFIAFFLSFSASFNEIGNRILYMYYVIEMGLLCFFVDRKMFNVTTFIIISYGFAFNIWTILGGI